MINCSNADGFCEHCNTFMIFYIFCFCQEAQPAITEQETQHGTKKLMRCENSMWRRKVTLLSKCGNVIGGKSTKVLCR